MPNRQSLGPWALALLNISAILSLRHLPAQAFFGLDSVIFYAIGAVIFLIPLSLICAELATTWPNRHGLYGWVFEAFGPRAAFVTVWWSWMAAVATIVTNLVFLTLLLVDLLYPQASQQTSMILVLSLGILWSMTFLNLRGMRFSAALSSFGGIVGTIFPIVLLCSLSIYLSLQGDRTLEHLTQGFWQNWQIESSDLSLLSTIILGYSGVELAAFHAADARNPQKDYLKALMIAAGAIAILYILGTLAIIFVISPSELTLTLGVVQAFNAFFALVQWPSMGPWIQTAMILGTLAAINSWLISPAKGIFAAAEHFVFPQWMSYSNRFGVPAYILILQAVIASCLLIVLKFSPNVESSFWILSMLTTQYAIVLYLPIVAAFVVLKFQQPHTPRPFSLKKPWALFCALSTFLTALIVLILTLFPPQRVAIDNLIFYEFFFVLCFVTFSLPPLMFKKYSQGRS